MKISTSVPRSASRRAVSTTYTFSPPASPVPGCSSGEVCTDSIATRRSRGSRTAHRPSCYRPVRPGPDAQGVPDTGRRGRNPGRAGCYSPARGDGTCRYRSAGDAGRPLPDACDARHDEPEPAAPGRPLAGRARRPPGCAARRPHRRRPRLRRHRGDRRRAASSGSGGCGRTSRSSAWRSTPSGSRAALPLTRPGPDVRARRLRGAAARRRAGRWWCGRSTCCGSTTRARSPGPGTPSAARLAPGGLLVDGTCDEIGRRAAWVAVTPEDGPVSLTLSLRLAGLERPGRRRRAAAEGADPPQRAG